MCDFYLLNHASSDSISDMTPHEAWSGHKPCVGHLKIFRSIAYSNVPDERRSKLDKSQKCIFVSYSERSKAYKLFNPLTNKIIVSKHVKFNEEATWDWTEKEKKKNSILLDIELEKSEIENASSTSSYLSTSSSSSSSSSSSEDDGDPVIDHGDSSSPPSRRSTRPHQRSNRYPSSDYVMVTNSGTNFALFMDVDPITYEDACQDEKWVEAMDQKIDSVKGNDT